jgi:hypothetical protein
MDPYLTKHGDGLFYGGHEIPHVLLSIVESEGRSHSAGDAIAGHQRLAAVMPSAHRHAHLVHQSADIVVMETADVE